MGVGYRLDPVAPITVGALKELLAKWPDEAWVVLSSDAEGNAFKPLLEMSDEFVDLTVEHGYGRVEVHDAGDGRGRAVVLWPYD